MARTTSGLKLLAAALLLALLPVAQVAALPIVAPQAELPRTKLRLDTSSGRHNYSVEIAASPEQQERGLMFRTAMAANQGMIFPFAPPRPASFWMENTILPLDIVFIGADSRVLNVAADAKPYSRDLIQSSGAAAAVLELNAGEAAKIGLKPGDAVRYKLPG
ncbi:DUF192 domain-containing protein [Sphingosinicellaceae bacterium]|nr:DUF192 domain-containing protein [Sphingosinicellaceae bacterium]